MYYSVLLGPLKVLRIFNHQRDFIVNQIGPLSLSPNQGDCQNDHPISAGYRFIRWISLPSRGKASEHAMPLINIVTIRYVSQLQNDKQGTYWSFKKARFILRKIFQKRRLPLHLGKSQLSVWIFVPGQSFLFPFGAELEHVRVRVLCPTPHVTLHGCHDDHLLQLPLTDDFRV